MMIVMGGKPMKNAFGSESESEDMGTEDKKETSGVVLTFSAKDGQKIMDYCDSKGIAYEQDME